MNDLQCLAFKYHNGHNASLSCWNELLAWDLDSDKLCAAFTLSLVSPWCLSLIFILAISFHPGQTSTTRHPPANLVFHWRTLWRIYYDLKDMMFFYESAVEPVYFLHNFE